MSAMSQDEFEDHYHALLLRSWTSEDFVTELLSDPISSLREVGLTVPDGTNVTILRQTAGEGSIDEQFAMWEAGLADHNIELVVPEVPPVSLGELSDSELAAVSGGTDYCCCPCCTCTA